MSSTLSRTVVVADGMSLPPSATPRPGDDVVWYVDAQRANGTYLGYGPNSEPVVRTAFGTTTRLRSFDCLRIQSPESRVGPNWHSLSANCLVSPLVEEKRRFDELLSQQIPPGPTYLELVEEIWHRGYEVYVVGGTVRDVVSGEKSNDVDLVTTMPLGRFEDLLSSMFKKLVSIREVNGFARLGGRGDKGDPFIDLKSFCHGGMGTPNALFGADFLLDLQLRDFACNAIYYDPINKVLIDPSGRGVRDAKNRILSVVCNPSSRPPIAKGQIAIRYFKFCMRGYKGDVTSDQIMSSQFFPCLSAMTNTDRIAYVNRQILGKIEKAKHTEAITALEAVMYSTGNAAIWEALFKPVLEVVGGGI